jgi:hypothetical protein
MSNKKIVGMLAFSLVPLSETVGNLTVCFSFIMRLFEALEMWCKVLIKYFDVDTMNLAFIMKSEKLRYLSSVQKEFRKQKYLLT